MREFSFGHGMVGEYNGSSWNDLHGCHDNVDVCDGEAEGDLGSMGGDTCVVVVSELKTRYKWNIVGYNEEGDWEFAIAIDRSPCDDEGAALLKAELAVQRLIEDGELDRTWYDADYTMRCTTE